MKKTLCILAITLLTLCCVFSGCTQQARTTVAKVRWGINEQYEFDITLADYAEQGDDYFTPTLYNNEKFFRDTQIRTSKVAEQRLTGIAEKIPNSLTGKMTTKLARGANTTTFETHQTLQATYNTDYLKNLSSWSQLQKLVISTVGNETTLYSQIDKFVEFENDDNQKPVRSSTTIIGYSIIENIYDGISAFKVENVYDLTSQKVDITTTEYELSDNVNDTKAGTFANTTVGEPHQHNVNVPSIGHVIDSNQMLVFCRSFEKQSDNFNDAPYVSVYDAVSQKNYNMYFGFKYDVNSIVNINNESVFTKLSALSVSLEDNPCLVLMNLSDQVGSADKALEQCYTVVKFRSGFCSYELSSYKPSVVTALSNIIVAE